jgi:hypothetical protein
VGKPESCPPFLIIKHDNLSDFHKNHFVEKKQFKSSCIPLHMPLKDSDIEKILSEEQHIIRIHPSEKWDDFLVDASYWPSEKRELAVKSARYIHDYMNFPYIEDDFGIDHFERREWQAEMVLDFGSELYYFFSRNSLKAGFAYFVLGAQLMGINDQYIGPDNAGFKEKIRNVGKGLPPKKEYVLELSTEQKIETMHALKCRIDNLLHHVYKKQS